MLIAISVKEEKNTKFVKYLDTKTGKKYVKSITWISLSRTKVVGLLDSNSKYSPFFYTDVAIPYNMYEETAKPDHIDFSASSSIAGSVRNCLDEFDIFYIAPKIKEGQTYGVLVKDNVFSLLPSFYKTFSLFQRTILSISLKSHPLATSSVYDSGMNNEYVIEYWVKLCLVLSGKIEDTGFSISMCGVNLPLAGAEDRDSILMYREDKHIYLSDGVVVVRLLASYVDYDYDTLHRKVVKFRISGKNCHEVIGGGIRFYDVVAEQAPTIDGYFLFNKCRFGCMMLNSGDKFDMFQTHINKLVVNMPFEEFISNRISLSGCDKLFISESFCESFVTGLFDKDDGIFSSDSFIVSAHVSGLRQPPFLEPLNMTDVLEFESVTDSMTSLFEKKVNCLTDGRKILTTDYNYLVSVCDKVPQLISPNVKAILDEFKYDTRFEYMREDALIPPAGVDADFMHFNHSDAVLLDDNGYGIPFSILLHEISELVKTDACKDLAGRFRELIRDSVLPLSPSFQISDSFEFSYSNVYADSFNKHLTYGIVEILGIYASRLQECCRSKYINSCALLADNRHFIIKFRDDLSNKYLDYQFFLDHDSLKMMTDAINIIDSLESDGNTDLRVVDLSINGTILGRCRRVNGELIAVVDGDHNTASDFDIISKFCSKCVVVGFYSELYIGKLLVHGGFDYMDISELKTLLPAYYVSEYGSTFLGLAKILKDKNKYVTLRLCEFQYHMIRTEMVKSHTEDLLSNIKLEVV